MKRLVPVVAALTLIGAACGDGDDSASDTVETTVEATVEATIEATAETTAEGTGETSDEATSSEETGENTGDDTVTEDATTDAATTDPPDDMTETDDTDDGDGGIEVQSIDDVPQACQDEMAAFLRALEPIVSPIDWQTATMGDFEEIADEFQTEADEFQAATSAAGCDDLRFEPDAEIDILIDFAGDEAPDAVGFLEFLEQMRTSSMPDDDAAAEAGIETCQDAIDFLQGLMDDYETMAEVPASEVMKIPSIAPLYAECTPEQLEFFEDPDLELFMSE